jgi:tetratricopeptide (TPR) repeat protein
VSFKDALHAALKKPTDHDLLVALAEAALHEGEEEKAISLLAPSIAQRPTALLWQWKGLLERAIDEHEDALESFEHAARLEPGSASIAHGRARVALEAGVPSEARFEQALRLSPSDGSVLLGLAAARLAAGHGERAEAELDGALDRSPLWIEGHMQLAQLRSMLGKRELLTASLDRALQRDRGQARLWQALFDLHVKSDDFEALNRAINRAAAADVGNATTLPYRAIAAAELDKPEQADRLFAELHDTGGPNLAVWKIRHFLRSGRPQQALPLIDSELAGSGAAHTWPYAALTWRQTGDPRWEWLFAKGALISTFDLTRSLPPLGRLAEVLRSVHAAKSEYLDQSVRGGTQTDGPLFCRMEPEIRSLRSAVTLAVRRYTSSLPAVDDSHPLLSRRRDRRVRFAGSWSVRLKDNGFHTSHVHPQGWISSALYVDLPPESADQPNAGWLQLGQPRAELKLPLKPLRLIKPEAGRLVLFPSWMWHGTLPFPAGERLTVAFDVAAPR